MEGGGLRQDEIDKLVCVCAMLFCFAGRLRGEEGRGRREEGGGGNQFQESGPEMAAMNSDEMKKEKRPVGRI